MMATGQRAEPAAIHISTGPHKQEHVDEGCHEETPLSRRPGSGGEWQTGPTGDTLVVERAVYLTRVEDKPREDGSAAHRPSEGRAGAATSQLREATSRYASQLRATHRNFALRIATSRSATSRYI